MNLLICHSEDSEALWLYARCMQYKAPLTLVNADSLPSALQWDYRLSTRETFLNILPANKKSLAGKDIGVVINRVRTAVPLGWQGSDPAERQYVAAEMHAFFFSWLYSLSAHALLLNPPAGNGLSGQYLSYSQWLRFACQAGLPVGDHTEDTREPAFSRQPGKRVARSPQTGVLAVQDNIFGGPLPPATAEACIRLARLSGNHMLEIILEKKDEWRFVHADPFPCFSRYGVPFVHYVLRLLGT